MKTHFDHLIEHVPDLVNRRILDLGAGKGGLVILGKELGFNIVGYEKFQNYINDAQQKAKEKNLSIIMEKGEAEHMPFTDASFDFVNMSEVIEHVQDPKKTMQEVFRVLAQGGKVYVSVPNRFGLRDQHFGLFFVNWIPRAWSSVFISLFGKHKKYTEDAGFQKLDEMHYFTWNGINCLLKDIGFDVVDIRVMKISKRMKSPVSRFFILRLYFVLRFCFFDAFHILVTKK